MIACANNKICETVKVIMDQTPNISAEDLQGWTALLYAAKQGSLESVKLLIEHKAEIDAKNDKNETALFLAAKNNHPDIVEYLIENNCLLQTKTLEVAVQQNFAEIAKCLLFQIKRTKELNEKELNELLLKAAKEDQTKIAHELVINGANVNYNTGTICKILNYIFTTI